MGTSFQDQLNNLERIFKKMDEHNLRLNTKKCKFFTKKAQLLGHVIKNGEVRPAEESVEAYKNMKSPKTIKDVRALLSLLLLQEIHKSFTRISRPINELISGVNDKAKNTKVNWTPECEAAAQELKNCICSRPILKLFNPERETYIHCDASSYALGAVLLQKWEDGQLRPVTFHSE